MAQHDSLPIPVENNISGAEILRVWVIDGGLRVSILPDYWQDTAAWGIVIADVIRHIATAKSEQLGLDEEDVLRSILAGLDAEMGR